MVHTSSVQEPLTSFEVFDCFEKASCGVVWLIVVGFLLLWFLSCVLNWVAKTDPVACGLPLFLSKPKAQKEQQKTQYTI
jgi:hypothetical protein